MNPAIFTLANIALVIAWAIAVMIYTRGRRRR